jgi:glucose/arabinose dehydrogenase
MPAGKNNKWSGNAFISGLKSKAIFRLEIQNSQILNQERFYIGKRIRAVTVSSDLTLWAIEDGNLGGLLKLELE